MENNLIFKKNGMFEIFIFIFKETIHTDGLIYLNFDCKEIPFIQMGWFILILIVKRYDLYRWVDLS